MARKPTKALLFFGIAINVVLLGYFKYADFAIETADQVFGVDWAAPHILLPLAISFFTFQQIAYLADAHDGLVVEHDFFNYSLFITFFPHLIAGPITGALAIRAVAGRFAKSALGAESITTRPRTSGRWPCCC